MHIKNYKQNFKVLLSHFGKVYSLCSIEFSIISKFRDKMKGKHYYLFSKWFVQDLKLTHLFIYGFI